MMGRARGVQVHARGRGGSGRSRLLLIAACMLPLCLGTAACDGTIAGVEDGGLPWPAFAGDGSSGGGTSQLQGSWSAISVNGESLPEPVAYVDPQNKLELDRSEMDVCGDSWSGTSWYTMTIDGQESPQSESAVGRVDTSGSQITMIRTDGNEPAKTVTFSGGNMITTAPSGDWQEWQKTSSTGSC